MSRSPALPDSPPSALGPSSSSSQLSRTSGDVSLAARLDIDTPVMDEAVGRKELVLAWSLRGAPHFLPPEDFAVFTLGARPDDDTLEALRARPRRGDSVGGPGARKDRIKIQVDGV